MVKIFHDLLLEEGKISPYEPMLARWDRALYELRQTWPRGVECPVPPGESHPPAYERKKAGAAPEE